MVGYVESTVSMGIQIIVLGLLMGAVFLKIRKKYRQHGIVMLSAVVLHLISIIAVMGPSFAKFVDTGLINFSDELVMVTFVHFFAGLIAALLGVWLVGSWHLKVDVQDCFRKKRVMYVTIILWILAILLGIFLYLVIVRVI